MQSSSCNFHETLFIIIVTIITINIYDLVLSRVFNYMLQKIKTTPRKEKKDV